MAEIPRLQSGRVQVQGVSNLPQPNMNFGQQRPEIEFQASAESSSLLSRTLSNLSTQMFGQAQSLADVAGAQFVAENPVTPEELQAMSDGNVGKFKRDFSMNAFGAAVNKFKANELAAHAELELITKANDIQLKIETGKNSDGTEYNLDVTKIAADWKAQTNGFSSALAQISPDASYKLRATAAVHGNKLLLAATKAQNQKTLTQNKVKIVSLVDQYSKTVESILKGERPLVDGQVIPIDQRLQAERQSLLNQSLALGGIDGQTFAFEQSDKIEFEVKTTVFENAILYRKGDLGGDLASLNYKIRDKTLPADLQAVWDSMTSTQQKQARDKMVAQYQQLIDIKNKDREIDKSDTIVRANNAKLRYLDSYATPDDRKTAIAELTEISRLYPDVIDAKTIYEMPKLLKETAEDDYEGVAKLDDLLRNKDPLLSNSTKILEKARGLGVTPKTAIELANRYLPKDAKESDKAIKTAEIEYYLRTKLADPATKKSIKTLSDLRNALEMRGLTLADAPNNYVQLLTAPPESGDDNPDQVNSIIDAIDTGRVRSASEVTALAKGKLIKPETIISLGKRVGDRQLQLDLAADRVGGRISDASGSQSPTTRARLKLEGSEETKQELKKMVSDWENKGRVGPAPTIRDAGDIVEKRYLDKKEKSRITATQQSIESNYGMNGSMMPQAAKDAKVNLPAIRPTFKAGDAVLVTDEYRRALEAEFKRAGVEQRVYDPIINQVIQQQIFIEKTIRGLGGR